MPIPLEFNICPTSNMAKITELEDEKGPLLAWWHTSVAKNRRDGNQPHVQVIFRELLANGLLSDNTIKKYVPLTDLGQIHIGSIWKSGCRTSMLQLEEKEFDVDFSIEGWRHTSFYDAIRNGEAEPYPREIYPLEYPRDKVPLIKFKLVSGGNLLIPCLEFFSRCYGRSQELNRIIATYMWVGADNPHGSRLYAPLDAPEIEGKWTVKLRKRLLNGDVTLLAHAKYDPYTEMRVKEIHAQIDVAYNPKTAYSTYLKIAPWFQGPAKIRVRGISFKNDSFLALQIIGCSDPAGNLIRRSREGNDKSTASVNPNGSMGSTPPQTVFKPPHTIINLTGTLPPDNDSQRIEVLDNEFYILGIPRAIEDIHGNQIKDYQRATVKDGGECPSTYSAGEPTSSGKGVGQAVLHARPVIESHGWLPDMWKASLHLKEIYDKRVQNVSWFTFDNGYKNSEPPNLIALKEFNSYEDSHLDVSVRNWPYINTSTLELRGALVIRLIIDQQSFHIIELQRRPVNKKIQIDGKAEKKPSEQNFQGLILNCKNNQEFQKTLRNYLNNIRYTRGVVQKLVTQIEQPAASFSHSKPTDNKFPGLPALFNALRQLRIYF